MMVTADAFLRLFNRPIRAPTWRETMLLVFVSTEWR
jgi:hypothetical protein